MACVVSMRLFGMPVAVSIALFTVTMITLVTMSPFIMPAVSVCISLWACGVD